ncbi:ArnT family glycosyltransferase [Singulisphaera acidiphila]|uniref:PMT family glycosyltransferase, 4-amino-4-deoxy-L-arabinose transferase n=1 Tax=Singulisphaera acidiphila (strain ATCC BAA-1392 / DSM 18658 / VKM B-2454 / MOB10) TaxID=886293 RepID=L0DPL1_SINAD|nr:glycosyltransferase family 39 protein [Singulisphaera acidiphila]AGA31309.1 PMT family glycosyltransferase, 4-amino-4-deoxy-L-arabinose transferase [Singulisphaera acidiphila DSM 18658]
MSTAAANPANANNGRRTGWLVAAALSLHACMLAFEAWHLSPTCLEAAHLASGLSHWKLGRYELYCVNPPLVRMVAAVPVSLVGCRLNWGSYETGPGTRPEYPVGRDFVAVNGVHTLDLITLARWACIPFSLIGGYTCFRWARDLYGVPSGFSALLIWCTFPEVLAHGALITPDAAASSLGVAAAYGYWRWLRSPNWPRVFIAGLLLGLTELSKTSWLFLFGLWPMIWVVSRGRRPVIQLVSILALGLYVLNLGYGFTGTFQQLAKYRFVSATLNGITTPKVNPSHHEVGNRFAGSWLGAVRVPLPKDYVIGLDLQKRDFENYQDPSYLRGEIRDRGWWYYYLYGLGVKVPLGIWLIAMLAGLPSPRRGTWGPDMASGLVLLAPPLILFALVSSQTRFSIHFRYVLPVFPFAFVWMSQVATKFQTGPRFARRMAVAALAWSILSSLWVFPHSLSYFNELAGGAFGGNAHMLVSSVDWGQDLSDLHRWVRSHTEARPLWIAYYGGFDPSLVGLDFPPPPACDRNGGCLPKPGWYAVSVNLLRGLPHDGYPQGAFRHFLRFKPVATAGYSIYIYYIPPETDGTDTVPDNPPPQ